MITPSDTPSSPADYASVTPHGRGPAPYDIQAPSPADAVTAAFDASVADAGAGVLYPRSERQRDTETLMTSDAGYGEQDIDGGSAFGWPNNVEPGG